MADSTSVLEEKLLAHHYDASFLSEWRELMFLSTARSIGGIKRYGHKWITYRYEKKYTGYITLLRYDPQVDVVCV